MSYISRVAVRCDRDGLRISQIQITIACTPCFWKMEQSLKLYLLIALLRSEKVRHVQYARTVVMIVFHPQRLQLLVADRLVVLRVIWLKRIAFGCVFLHSGKRCFSRKHDRERKHSG